MADKLAAQEGLLPILKLKTLANLADTQPVGAAFGLTKDMCPLLLLHKTAKPRKVARQLKEDAKASLDPNTMRFGRITIAPNEPNTITFVVNKKEAGGTVPALLILIRRIGYAGIVINPDAALEIESEDDTDAAAPTAAPTQTTGQPANEAPPSPPAPPPPAPPLDAAALTRTLAELIKQVPAAANGDAAVQQKLAQLATAARDSLKTSDLAAVAQGIAALKRALSDGSKTAAPPSLGKAGSNGAAVALAKSALLWDTTRKYLEDQITPLEKIILEAAADEHDFDAIKAGVPVLRQVMQRLDARLSEKLNQAYGTQDQAGRVKLRQEAKVVVGEYETYMAADKLIGALDGNPFNPEFDGVARVQTTLKAIATYL
jgi:hypothetical protein